MPQNRFQVVPVRRGPELGAQVAHVGLQGALRAVRGVRGDALQQDGLGQDLAGVLHQQLQDGVLRPGEGDRLSGGRHRVGDGVQRQVAAGIGRRQGRAGPLPQPHGHPGQQLLGVKGLGEVIHRAAQQQSHPVLYRGLGADHNGGDPGQLRQQRLAGEPRQHQVQQDEVRPELPQQEPRLRAGVGPAHGIARPLQHLLLQIPDGGVVVNDENGLHSLSSFQGPHKGRGALPRGRAPLCRSVQSRLPSPPMRAVISSDALQGEWAARRGASGRWT